MSKKIARLDCGGERKMPKAVCIKKPMCHWKNFHPPWSVMRIYDYTHEFFHWGDEYWVSTNNYDSAKWFVPKKIFEDHFLRIEEKDA